MGIPGPGAVTEPRKVGRRLEKTIEFSSWPPTKCQARPITATRRKMK